MASSRVMASSSPPQHGAGSSSSDLARFRSSSGIGSMNMDDIIRNIYGPDAVNAAAGAGPAEPSPAAAAAAPEAAAAAVARRTSEEVWKEISAAGGLSAPVLLPPPPAACSGTGGSRGGAAEMTLEDFLARDSCARAAVLEGNMALGFPDADGGDAAGSGVAGGVGVGGGRGSTRKRALLDPADRAVMQRQKRMIKNRESAARSRDRKQAYVAELESQVMQLEEEQAELLREQEDRRQNRLKEMISVRNKFSASLFNFHAM
ncbi:bZIP transcription factor 23 isoform X2 [Sorghum bicolor]|uniref:bZIP transcription factor 23 isoform X2 n=1 Tax=Sorghum bicolor TaxID=4558 RepID=UPI000B424D78|nr:bZIP transcription factor 23 isoform X2 [Sorghum bicolor]|eukprot:XP_021304113.1 bZIP transcription factor 23 isoform X2 [Sorghum bicolor]